MSQTNHQINYQLRRLGRTELLVNCIGFGCCAIGGSKGGTLGYGATDDTTSLLALESALECGCNFFDTANVYGLGHSETLLGYFLLGRRKDLIISTKIGYRLDSTDNEQDFSPTHLRSSTFACLRRLQTDYIDILQLHNPKPTSVFDPEVISTLEKLRDDGWVRFLGVSAETTSDAEGLAEATWIDTLQIRFNLLDNSAKNRVFPVAKLNDLGIIAREPLANGFLSGKFSSNSSFPANDFRSLYDRQGITEIVNVAISSLRHNHNSPNLSPAQFAIRSVVRSPIVSVTIPGAKTPGQVLENMSNFIYPHP